MYSLKVFIKKAEPVSLICKTGHLPKCVGIDNARVLKGAGDIIRQLSEVVSTFIAES